MERGDYSLHPHTYGRHLPPSPVVSDRRFKQSIVFFYSIYFSLYSSCVVVVVVVVVVGVYFESFVRADGRVVVKVLFVLFGCVCVLLGIFSRSCH